MVSFTLTCNVCGNQTTFTQNGEFIEDNNDSLSVYNSGYEGQFSIDCSKCGSKVEDKL